MGFEISKNLFIKNVLSNITTGQKYFLKDLSQSIRLEETPFENSVLLIRFILPKNVLFFLFFLQNSIFEIYKEDFLKTN